MEDKGGGISRATASPDFPFRCFAFNFFYFGFVFFFTNFLFFYVLMGLSTVKNLFKVWDVVK